MKQGQMKTVLLLSKISLIISMLGWFFYFWVALWKGLLIFKKSHNKSSLTLMLSSLTILLKKAFSFSAISISDDMMLLLSTSAMFSFVFTFSEKWGLTIFHFFFLLFLLTSLTLFRIGGRGQKGPPYQLFPCNFYKGRNWPLKLSDF